MYKRLCKAKKPNSAVPGDVPKKILKEFTCELSNPLTVIFNSILRTLDYPRQWVIEYQIPIPKVTPPESLDDLRNIAKTAFASKVFESFLADWLLPIVKPYIDPCQYGLKGTSVTHYLVKLLKFIHTFIDLHIPHAVALAMIDLSKAFNRVSHQIVLEDLHNMKVPSWLLRILSSYLTGRTMILSYGPVSSSPRPLPGSSPQGAFLGIFLFIVKFNAASIRPAIPREYLNCPLKQTKCRKDDCVKHRKDIHALYIDDLSELEAINLKEQLVTDLQNRPLPLNFHERFGKVLKDDSTLQKNLTKIQNFTLNNRMKINEKKSKVMLFNMSKSLDFPPEFKFKDGDFLEVLTETRLLGVQLHRNLKWDSNTGILYKKAMKKMWLIRRMKILGLEANIILEYYLKEIRPLTEHGVVAWNSGLTKSQSKQIEKIQKVAFKIILSHKYQTYEAACKSLCLPTLSQRRTKLCINFAVNLFRSSRRDEFFTVLKQKPTTRGKQKLVLEEISRTSRNYNAPHNYLSRLVNENSERILKNWTYE